jgi:tetratricopeptide (TPR) repeat protein/tRNA A-37 threonylcarbamoyl transferase component Bud32
MVMGERDILIEALQRTEPAERAAYLDQACAGDEALQRRVEQLLEAHAGASEVLKAPAPCDASTSEVNPPPTTDGDTRLASSADCPPPPTSTEDIGSTAPGETKTPSGDEPFDSDGLFDVTGLAEFNLLAELGRGGMGVVYKARHRQLKRVVALKMIGDGKYASPGMRERFLIEAEAVARLRHPNIVQIYDIGEAGGNSYVTLELLEGGSLADRLKGTTQPGRAAAELVATLATAMHAAHQAGIVHRDLKPPNVLFDRDGTPKITDFGLAKRLEVEQGHTVTGQIMGTPSYMAPEQAQGLTHQMGPPADIYALGAILYEMLTGRPPFMGSSLMETLHQVVYDDVVPPSRIQPRIARDLETICLKCLERPPQKRYATAAALADDLRRYLDDLPIQARRTPAWERAAKWVRRHPTAATLMTLGTLAVLALAIGSVAGARIENQRVARRRSESEQLLDAYQTRLLARKWGDGQLIGDLSKLVTGLKPEPRLVDIRGRAERLLDQAARGLRDEEDGRRDHERLETFIQRRDAAFLSENRYTNVDLPADPKATRAAARAALDVFATPGPDQRWTLGPLPRTLTAQEQAEVGEDRYGLLLILAGSAAEATAGEDPVQQARLGLNLLDQAAALRPQPTAAYHRLRANCLARNGDAAGADRERAVAGRLQVTTALEHFLMGQEAFKRHDWKTALEEFDTTLRMQPGHFWALCLSAVSSIQTSNPGLAKLGLNGCIERRPDFAWLFLLRGLASGQQAVQARVVGKTLGITGGSIEAQAEAQFEAAEADFRAALVRLEMAPSDELRYTVLVDRALMRFQRGRLDDSAADLRAAIQLDGRYYNAMASLAQVLQRQKKWDEAVDQFTQAIARKPDLAALYRGRAAVQQERDDQSPAHRVAALADLDEAIRRETPGQPIQAGDHTARATLLRRDQRYNEALAACDAALKIAPDYDVVHRLRVLLLLDLGRPDEVIRSCDGALARGKPWPDILEIRGLARASRRDYAGAIDDYSHALYVRGDQPRLLSARGWAWVFSDAPRQALRDFDEALRLDTSNGEAHSGRGLALALVGDHRAAVAAAEESLRHDAPTARRAYNAARVYARAAAAAASEVADKGRLAVTQVERYQDRAVALVKLALERTPRERRAAFWHDEIEADPALRSLQRRLRTLQPAGATNRAATGPAGAIPPTTTYWWSGG